VESAGTFEEGEVGSHASFGDVEALLGKPEGRVVGFAVGVKERVEIMRDTGRDGLWEPEGADEGVELGG
jgi:hypothetical protein